MNGKTMATSTYDPKNLVTDPSSQWYGYASTPTGYQKVQNYAGSQGMGMPGSYSTPASNVTPTYGAGYDASGNPISEATPTSPNTPGGFQQPSGSGFGTPTSATGTTSTGSPLDPATQTDAYAQLSKQAKGEISAIEGYYNNLLTQSSEAEKKTQAANTASALAAGMGGSGTQTAAYQKTAGQAETTKENLTAQMTKAIQDVYAGIESNAITLDQVGQPEQATVQKNAQGILANLATALPQAGKSLADFQEADPSTYQTLMTQLGYTSDYEMAAAYNAAIPKQYQPQVSTTYAAAPDGSTIVTTVISTTDPNTGITSQKTSTNNIPTPYANMQGANILKDVAGNQVILTSKGAINVMTNQPYGVDTSTVTTTQAQKTIQDQITQYGSNAFANMTEDQKRQLEKDAGYPKGYLDNLPETITQQKAQSTIANQNQYIKQKDALIKAAVTPKQTNKGIFGFGQVWEYTDPGTGQKYTAGSLDEAQQAQNQLLNQELQNLQTQLTLNNVQLSLDTTFDNLYSQYGGQ